MTRHLMDILLTISHTLIDIHQQFDTLDFIMYPLELRMIDAIAGNKSTLKNINHRIKIHSGSKTTQ